MKERQQRLIGVKLLGLYEARNGNGVSLQLLTLQEQISIHILALILLVGSLCLE